MIIHDAVVLPLVKLKDENGNLHFFVGVSRKRLPKRSISDFYITQEKLPSGENLIVGWSIYAHSHTIPVLFKEENAPEEGEVFTIIGSEGKAEKKKLTYRVPQGYKLEVNSLQKIKIGFLVKEE